MRRLLLVSTAALGVAAAPPVLAQQTTPAAPASAPAQPAETITGAPAPKPVPEQTEHQVRAHSLIGVDVSDGEATIGKVSDLVVTDDGRVEAIVVGVGGFLGLGAKRVALTWDSVKLTEQDGKRVFLVSATRKQLEGMPEFKTLEEKQAEAAAAAGQPPTGAVAPGVTPAPAPQPDKP